MSEGEMEERVRQERQELTEKAVAAARKILTMAVSDVEPDERTVVSLAESITEMPPERRDKYLAVLNEE